VEVASGFYAPHLIPGNDVTQAFADLEVAMRANPSFAVISIRANTGLGGVLDSALHLAASKAKSNSAEV
jgi:hypothetical protein